MLSYGESRRSRSGLDSWGGVRSGWLRRFRDGWLRSGLVGHGRVGFGTAWQVTAVKVGYVRFGYGRFGSGMAVMVRRESCGRWVLARLGTVSFGGSGVLWNGEAW